MTVDATRPSADMARAEQAIAKLALAYPDVVENNPWGHRAFKVRGKTFLFLGADRSGLSFSLKLPSSGPEVLQRPGAEPTHYGLGKSGWVTLSYSAGDKVPLADVKRWLEESFAAVAPKARAPRGAKPAAKKKAAARPAAKQNLRAGAKPKKKLSAR